MYSYLLFDGRELLEQGRLPSDALHKGEGDAVHVGQGAHGGAHVGQLSGVLVYLAVHKISNSKTITKTESDGCAMDDKWEPDDVVLPE